MDRNVILFAGQSGISARDCLQRVAMAAGGEASVLSLEDEMEEATDRRFRSEILDECIGTQYAIWREGFEKMKGSIDVLSPDNPVFVSFHAVYYHPKEREFFSPADPRSFLDLQQKTKAVVVLIDDIFDVYTRLLQPGQIYDRDVNHRGVEGLRRIVGHLLEVLQWRQLEISFARTISRLLDVPFLQIAMKHNVEILARLATRPMQELRPVYLSHPITSVRRGGSELLGFRGQLNEFARLLRAKEDVLLIEPTTIDEFKRFAEIEERVLAPSLTWRWPVSSSPEQQIAPPLPAAPGHSCLDPQASYGDMSSEEQNAINHILRILEGQIEMQLNSRDFSLVEQCTSGVVAYRPYYPDRLSGGVDQELRHNLNLHQQGLPENRRCLVLSLEQDLCRWRVRKFFGRIDMYLDEPSEETRGNLGAFRDQCILDEHVVRGFCDDKTVPSTGEALGWRLDDEEILPPGFDFKPSSIGVHTPLAGTPDAQRRERRRRAFGTACDEAVQDDIIPLVTPNGVNLPRLSTRDEIMDIVDELFDEIFIAEEAK